MWIEHEIWKTHIGCTERTDRLVERNCAERSSEQVDRGESVWHVELSEQGPGWSLTLVSV